MRTADRVANAERRSRFCRRQLASRCSSHIVTLSTSIGRGGHTWRGSWCAAHADAVIFPKGWAARPRAAHATRCRCARRRARRRHRPATNRHLMVTERPTQGPRFRSGHARRRHQLDCETGARAAAIQLRRRHDHRTGIMSRRRPKGTKSTPAPTSSRSGDLIRCCPACGLRAIDDGHAAPVITRSRGRCQGREQRAAPRSTSRQRCLRKDVRRRVQLTPNSIRDRRPESGPHERSLLAAGRRPAVDAADRDRRRAPAVALGDFRPGRRRDDDFLHARSLTEMRIESSLLADGKQVAFSWLREGTRSPPLRQRRRRTPLRLTSDEGGSVPPGRRRARPSRLARAERPTRPRDTQARLVILPRSRSGTKCSS